MICHIIISKLPCDHTWVTLRSHLGYPTITLGLPYDHTWVTLRSHLGYPAITSGLPCDHIWVTLGAQGNRNVIGVRITLGLPADMVIVKGTPYQALNTLR